MMRSLIRTGSVMMNDRLLTMMQFCRPSISSMRQSRQSASYGEVKSDAQCEAAAAAAAAAII